MDLQRFRSRKKAVILVVTMWMVVVLTLIASSLVFDVQVNSKLALLQREQFTAYSLAKSAIAVGMTHLQNDLLIDNQENPQQLYDAFSDVWAQPDRKEKDVEVELGKGTYQLEIADEDGKISLNHANVKILKAMLEYYGYEAPDSDDVAAAIIDFRDPDDVTGAIGEKENEYYSALLGQNVSDDMYAEDLLYQCANEAFLSTDQLLDIFGIAPEVYFGYDPESEEAKEQRVRDNIALGKTTRMAKKRQEEDLAMKDIVTVRGSGRININTASKEVLTILIHAATNFNDLDGAEAAADSLIEFRGTGRPGKAPDPDDAFKSVQDVSKVPGLNPQVFGALSNASNFGVTLAFKSDNFCITGIGRTGRSQRTVKAIVSRQLEVYNPDDPQLESNKNSSIGDRRRSVSQRQRSRGRGNETDQDNFIRIPAVRVLQWMD